MQLASNRTVVLTGAASGIGESLARQLNAAGCRLALADRQEDALTQLAGELNRSDDELLTAAFDVRERASVEQFAAQVLEHFGQVDLVINNAGVNLAQQVDAMNYDDLEWTMDINFYGMVYGAKAFLPALLKQGSGKLVFLSSVFGIVGIPTQSAYNASKFAIRGFAESLREEIESQGVDVLVVCPGGIKTNIIRNGRIRDSSAFGRSNEDPAKKFDRLAGTTAEQAAKQIFRAVEKDKKRLLIGRDAKLLDRLQRLFPASYHRKLKTLTKIMP